MRHSGASYTKAHHFSGSRSTNTVGTGFSPPLANPTLWYDAAQLVGADNSALGSWPALAGGSTYDLGQATGANKPTLYTTTAGKTVNGRPAVWFSGNQWMNPPSNPAALSQPLSVYVIAGVTVAANAQVFIDGMGASTRLCCYDGGSTYTVIIGSTGSGSIGTLTTGVHCFAFMANGATSFQFWLDGTTLMNSAGLGAASPVPFTFGADYTHATQLTGFICEVGVYSSLFSAGNLTTLRSYAQTKWGTP